ncbi:hypothetical protein [Streptomyces caniscabiei]|uniref:hypothetical protein n=1 Tax=Streptomyces caniscabiei TaxID=2746961 RepID=UPI003B986CD6
MRDRPGANVGIDSESGRVVSDATSVGRSRLRQAGIRRQFACHQQAPSRISERQAEELLGPTQPQPQCVLVDVQLVAGRGDVTEVPQLGEQCGAVVGGVFGVGCPQAFRDTGAQFGVLAYGADEPPQGEYSVVIKGWSW